MTQMIIDFDDKENEKIGVLQKKWDLSKIRTIKKIVKEYKAGGE